MTVTVRNATGVAVSQAHGVPSLAASPLDAADLRRRLQQELDAFLDQQSAVLGELGTDCEPLVGSVRGLLAGGKRLRPAFCYWGYRGAGGQDGPGVVRAAASLELFQAAALIHDDVMDSSDTRRGMPAVHRQFADLHDDGGWGGDRERFGQAGAILAGDLCLSWCDELLCGSGLPTTAVERGKAVFDRMRTQLMGGQYLDVLAQAVAGRHREDPVEAALRVVRFKSAKYTVEHPLLLGAALAGAGEEVRAAYSAFGLPLGEAFQLRDDVLGVFGDPGTTGKPAGDDLREGKRTVLVALTLRRADTAGRAVVERLLGDPGLDAAGVAALREVIVGTGALETVESMITERVRAAREALDAAPVTPQAAAVLHSLVDAATTRTA
ncbi:polyprenyl synthetase family protein [Kineosporiaceae bacterium SCSIO 59966]|nr:polyprenyl synthetase family protein [Kineosporiaceae bacterium SCSIO 59966]